MPVAEESTSVAPTANASACVELTSPDQIAALKALWLIEHPEREPSTTGNGYKKWAHTDEHKDELKRISDTYTASEGSRKVARANRKSAKLAREKEENARWDKTFKEKFEDKEYYSFRGFPLKREHPPLRPPVGRRRHKPEEK